MSATVLDSWAVLRFLEGVEPAAEHVQRAMASGPCLMSVANIAEVDYVVERSHGVGMANAVMADLATRVAAVHVTPELARRAARIKAAHSMALGDAFAAATAEDARCPVLTGDPELLIAGSSWQWRDLREPLAALHD